MKSLYPNSFIKLDTFYDQGIEVTLLKNIQRSSTKAFTLSRKRRLLSFAFIRRLEQS